MLMTLIISMILLYAALIGFVMETYKKGLREDRAGVWEIRLVALLWSLLSAVFIWAATDASEIQGIAVNSPWLIVSYTAAVYLLQKPACMKVWKPLLKNWMERM